MEAFKTIRQHYKPIQPTVKTGDSNVIYQELVPDKAIADLVYCFWQLKTKNKLNQDFVYRVVSDGCIDIFFEHNKPSQNFIMGFCRKYTAFPIGKTFDYIGIRFLPAAFPLLFGIDAKLLSDQSQELDKILPHFSKWIATKIDRFHSFERVSELLNEKLIELTNEQNFKYDQRFFKVLNLIFQKRGCLDTAEDFNIALSARQLRRIFNFYIGTTAKSFSNVVRFQHVLNAKPSAKSLKDNKLYYEVGFFDQAHFIKNFKTFYGQTPSKAFR